jgi:hypothetical protein
VHELVPQDALARQRPWSLATIAFALGQAVAAYGFSLLFARAHDAYPAMFALGGGALLLALAIDLLARPRGDGSDDVTAGTSR